ncbi:MAG: oxidoreductase [Marmoricola sp.]
MPKSDPLAWLNGLEGVPSAFAATRDGIDVLLRDRGMRQTTAEQTAESLLRGAHASAVLEGSASTLEEVREGAGDETAGAAVRVSTELLGLAPLLATSPLQVFARLHSLAAVGTVADDDLGRPAGPEAADRLNTLARTLVSTESPALMVAALAHAELATVGAFASHNGIVARAAERLIMAARGVDPFSVTIPEAGHLGVREAYESNLRGYRSGGQAGLRSWLLYAAEAYALGAERSPVREQ